MPLDYTGLLNVQRPLERAIQGYQVGTGLEQQKQDRAFVNEQRRQQQQAVQAQQEQARAMQADLAALAQDPNAGYEEHLQMQIKYPALKEHSKTFFDAKSEGEKGVIVKQSQDIVSMLQSGRTDLAVDTLEEAKLAAENAGQTDQARGAEAILSIVKTNPDAAKTAIVQQLAGIMEPQQFKNYMAATGIGGRGASDKRFFAPIVIQHAKTGEKKMMLPGGDPDTGKGFAAEIELPEGYEISSATAEEKAKLKIQTAAEIEEKKITGKGKAKRQQDAIEGGVIASGETANIRRAITLLESVKTGGINAASLRAQKFFGVEGANEGELSFRLGKAVLKQLKPTFGAAFTVEESNKLDRLEAGFGKSVPNNMRLLKQALVTYEKAGERGIKAAIEAEDYLTAQRIKDDLAFTLDVEESQPTSEPQQVGRFQIEVIQ
jgi:hypothetical protein